MPRTARSSQGGYCYHVLNRGNGRQTVFHKDGDYAAFLKLLAQAGERVPVRLLAYCLMPNHFHLALWPQKDGELSAYMMWLMTAHVRRYHKHYRSSGHVWQGRFKAFPVQEDDHLLTLLRYIERNPLRAAMVDRAQDWLWSSVLDLGLSGFRAIPPSLILPSTSQGPGDLVLGEERRPRPLLHPGPVARPEDWLKYVNEPRTEAEVEAMRECLRRGRPFGGLEWTQRAAQQLGLEASLRPRGRPRKPIASQGLFDAEAEGA